MLIAPNVDKVARESATEPVCVALPNRLSLFAGHASCNAGEFTCGSGRCVPLPALCDGADDCGDGWDETPRLCAPTRAVPACAASEFRCGDGRCVLQAWRCDGSADCSDGSDEDSCGERRHTGA